KRKITEDEFATIVKSPLYTARKVLAQLENQGAVRIEPHAGIEILPPADPEELRVLQSIRHLLRVQSAVRIVGRYRYLAKSSKGWVEACEKLHSVLNDQCLDEM